MLASFLNHSTMCVGCMHSISEESVHIVGVVICAPARAGRYAEDWVLSSDRCAVHSSLV